MKEYTLKGSSKTNGATFSIRFYDVDRYKNNPEEKGNPIGGNANGMNQGQFQRFKTAQDLVRDFYFDKAKNLMKNSGFDVSEVKM